MAQPTRHATENVTDFATKPAIAIVPAIRLKHARASNFKNVLRTKHAQALKNGSTSIKTGISIKTCFHRNFANSCGEIIPLFLAKPRTISSLTWRFKLVENACITVVETFFLTELFLAIDTPEILWKPEIETEILDKIVAVS